MNERVFSNVLLNITKHYKVEKIWKKGNTDCTCNNNKEKNVLRYLIPYYHNF